MEADVLWKYSKKYCNIGEALTYILACDKKVKCIQHWQINIIFIELN